MSLASYRKWRDRFWSQGLTSRGQPRQRRYYQDIPCRRRENNATRIVAQRQSQLAKYHRRALRFLNEGLTTRGTPRKISLIGRPSNPVEIAWRKFMENKLDI